MKKILKNLGAGLAMFFALGLNAEEGPVTAKIFNQLDKEIHELIAKEESVSLGKKESSKLRNYIERLSKSIVYAPESARLALKWANAIKAYQDELISNLDENSFELLSKAVEVEKNIGGSTIDQVKKSLGDFRIGGKHAKGLGEEGKGFTDKQVEDAFDTAPAP